MNQGFIAGATNPCGVAVDGGHIYWPNSINGTIGRANLDGTGVNQGFVGGASRPCGVAIDADPISGGQDAGGGAVITNTPPPATTRPPVDTAALVPTLGKIKLTRRDRRLVAAFRSPAPDRPDRRVPDDVEAGDGKTGPAGQGPRCGHARLEAGEPSPWTAVEPLDPPRTQRSRLHQTRHARDQDPDHEHRRSRQLGRAVGGAAAEDPPTASRRRIAVSDT